ncbi:hypothetical protein [Flocculibacter collagenilyticus]|uniref:hypothetical protein n=1 Tax=Flocculibacter collagenilyticus TaxID=2744479 RepID=UPI0018F34D3B|nr:hypothetical protein [Flocculibacter collagenilyticus]
MNKHNSNIKQAIHTLQQNTERFTDRYVVTWVGVILLLFIIGAGFAYFSGNQQQQNKVATLEQALKQTEDLKQLATLLPELNKTQQQIALSNEQRQELTMLREQVSTLRNRVAALTTERQQEVASKNNEINNYLGEVEALRTENEKLRRQLSDLETLAAHQENHINQFELGENDSITMIEGINSRFGIREIGTNLVKTYSGNALYFMRTAQTITLTVKPYYRCQVTLNKIDAVKGTAQFDYSCRISR